MDPVTPPINQDFTIENILQVGKVEVNGENVIFDQRPTDAEAIFRMKMETNGQAAGKATGQIEHLEGGLCLYNKDGILSAEECTTVSLDSSKWIYNHNGLANRWCLANTVNDSNPKCMVLGPIDPSARTANIKISDQSDAGDAWVNGREELGTS